MRFIMQPKEDTTKFLKIIVKYDPYSGTGNMFNPREEPVIQEVIFKHVPMEDLNMEKESYPTFQSAIADFENYKKYSKLSINEYDVVKLERSGWSETSRLSMADL